MTRGAQHGFQPAQAGGHPDAARRQVAEAERGGARQQQPVQRHHQRDPAAAPRAHRTGRPGRGREQGKQRPAQPVVPREHVRPGEQPGEGGRERPRHRHAGPARHRDAGPARATAGSAAAAPPPGPRPARCRRRSPRAARPGRAAPTARPARVTRPTPGAAVLERGTQRPGPHGISATAVTSRNPAASRAAGRSTGTRPARPTAAPRPPTAAAASAGSRRARPARPPARPRTAEPARRPAARRSCRPAPGPCSVSPPPPARPAPRPRRSHRAADHGRAAAQRQHAPGHRRPARTRSPRCPRARPPPAPAAAAGSRVHSRAARSWPARLPRVIRCSSRPAAANAAAVSTDPANTVSRTEVPPAADASACSPEARLPYTDGLPRQSCTARATGSPSRASMAGVIV